MKEFFTELVLHRYEELLQCIWDSSLLIAILLYQ